MNEDLVQRIKESSRNGGLKKSELEEIKADLGKETSRKNLDTYEFKSNTFNGITYFHMPTSKNSSESYSWLIYAGKENGEITEMDGIFTFYSLITGKAHKSKT